MATEIIMPKVDMVMETGTFVEWLKQEGDPVTKGEALFVIMTDKAAIECEAPASGTLAGVNAQPDEVIPVTNVIGYILAQGEQLPQNAPQEKQTLRDSKVFAGQAVEVSASSNVDSTVNMLSEEVKTLRATPLARLVARELGVDLNTVTGKGPRGRIYKSDVVVAAESSANSLAVIEPEADEPQPGLSAEGLTIQAAPTIEGLAVQLPNANLRERVPLKGARAIIASRLAYSAQTSPHIYLGINVDMTEVVRWRQMVGPKIEQRAQSRLSFTAIIAYVVARLLPNHPFLNSSLVDNEILLWEDVHLGIATALGDDLIVPVVRQADRLSLEETAKEMNRLLEAARGHKLLPAEMSGSTFTITNLGMFGIEDFTAIINPPEAAILAVAKMVDTPVAVDGQVAIRPIIHFTIGTDHRINDGLRAARFLNALKETLENPYLLF